MNVWPRISRPTDNAGALSDISSGDLGALDTTGEVVAIPNGTVAYSVWTIGTGAILLRAQSGDSLAGGNAPDATNCHVYPAGVLLGPFRTDSSADTHVAIAEHTGAAVTAAHINFHRA